MSRHFAIAFHPIEMSQKFLYLSLRFFVLAAVFLAESGSSTVKITRYMTGDVFQNANSSKTCIESGAACLLKVENSPFCGKNCCNCVCPSDTPTYLLRNGNCSSEDHLMSILKAQSQIQGCDHRMVVAEKHLQCMNEVLTTLDTKNPGNKSLYLCPWNAEPTNSQAMIHFQLVKNLNKCEIVPEESLFLVNGSWKNRSPHGSVFSELNVEIRPDPAVYNDKLYLKWDADIGRQYDGLIFSLKLRCHGKQRKNLTSCVHFKKAGSFTDIKPTLKPASLISTRARTTYVLETTAETVIATTLTSTGKPTPSTAHVSSSIVVDDVHATSLTGRPQTNIVLIILAALAGALFVLLACLAVVFLLWRRTRSFEVKKGADNATNPIYERGASDTLKMSKIPNGNGQAEEEWPEYQPLVENTKPRERADSLPGYRLLSIGQKPTNEQPTSDAGVRSSNYLSLIKDDPEENRMYQTLITDANPQKLEIVDEANIPDYAELEERSDSEDVKATTTEESLGSSPTQLPTDTVITSSHSSDPVAITTSSKNVSVEPSATASGTEHHPTHPTHHTEHEDTHTTHTHPDEPHTHATNMTHDEHVIYHTMDYPHEPDVDASTGGKNKNDKNWMVSIFVVVGLLGGMVLFVVVMVIKDKARTGGADLRGKKRPAIGDDNGFVPLRELKVEKEPKITHVEKRHSQRYSYHGNPEDAIPLLELHIREGEPPLLNAHDELPDSQPEKPERKGKPLLDVYGDSSTSMSSAKSKEKVSEAPFI